MMPGKVDGRRSATPRTGFCSRDEVARLLRAAYRGRGAEGGRGQTVHLARLILIAYYTCTRASVIERASFEREQGLPWIDLERGLFYRRPVEDYEGNQDWESDAEPILIPRPLLEHMKRWRKNGARRPVEHLGSLRRCRAEFRRLTRAVLDAERAPRVTFQTLRCTGASWLRAGEVSMDVVALLLSRRREFTKALLWGVPLHQEQVHYAFARAKAEERRAAPWRGGGPAPDSGFV
ncbi:hypothetical protein [Sinorhizobium meliloti]|uniref:hypothetical protein n=1 Tax=Rhizobium meliloti TaxID=382 RepID=UPI0013E3B2B4|nr:hypothetical protein [Sinorhizobium meliloti]